jgi:hypothetical protein
MSRLRLQHRQERQATGGPGVHGGKPLSPQTDEAIGDLRAALVKIMEAIEDGDVAYAYAIADAALGLEEAA